MPELAVLIQLTVAFTIINVWVFRHRKPTPFRPAGANNLKEEFARYGLPDWMRSATGAAKLTLAPLLIAGIWLQPVAPWAAAALGLLMLGAVAAHVKVGDPVHKALPALSMFILCALVVVAYGRIIPQDLLGIFRHGFINLHPSLLPRHRGPSAN